MCLPGTRSRGEGHVFSPYSCHSVFIKVPCTACTHHQNYAGNSRKPIPRKTFCSRKKSQQVGEMSFFKLLSKSLTLTTHQSTIQTQPSMHLWEINLCLKRLTFGGGDGLTLKYFKHAHLLSTLILFCLSVIKLGNVTD